MTIYRVIDDSTCVLTTANELEALRQFQKIMDKSEKASEWGWMEKVEV